MAKIYASGNYVIVEDGDNLYEYAKGHTLYLLVDDIFYIKEITQGQYKVSVSDLEAGNITAEDSGDVYNVATFTTFLRENTGFKTAPGGSGAEWGSIRGTLSTQSDLQSALDSKQDDLVSGTNIKTINGNSVLGSGDLIISVGGGLQGTQNYFNYFPTLTFGVDGSITAAGTTSLSLTSINQVIAYPFTPNKTITSSQLRINVTTLGVGLSRILIYSDLNGFPDTKLFESANIDVSTTGIKSITTTFTFNAGTTYWLAYHTNIAHSITAISTGALIPILVSNIQSAASVAYFSPATFGSAPNTYVYGSVSSTSVPRIFILP